MFYIFQTFFIAATFFDVLEQFGPLDSDLVEKRKYSKWRAAEILKALKEGRAPSVPSEPAVTPSFFHSSYALLVSLTYCSRLPP